MQVIRTLPHNKYNCEEIVELFTTEFCAHVKWTPENNYNVHLENEYKYILSDDVFVEVGWRLRDGKPQAPEVKVLEDIKIDHIEVIKESRKEAEYGGIKFAGLIVETDNDSQSKLTSAMVTYQVTQMLPPAWKCKDGWYSITGAEDFMALCMAVQAHVNECFIKEHMLTEAINAASTIEEVRAISWTD